MTALDQLRAFNAKLEAGREKPLLCGLCGGRLEVWYGRHSETWAVWHGRGLTFEGCQLDGRWWIREQDREAAIARAVSFFETL